MPVLNNSNLHYGGHSMVAPLKRVLVHKPTIALANADPKIWHYADAVCYKTAQQEHDEFVKILKSHNVEIIYHTHENDELADAIFVHDPVLITNQGAIILQMGKALRRGEEALLQRTLELDGIPILHKLSSFSCAECGDMLWLNDTTLLIGRGFRTNQLAIDELREVLLKQHVEVIPFDLSYYQGKEACLHLQSVISLADTKTALVYLPLLPAPLYQLLLQENFELIEVPEEEFSTMGPNILTLKPKHVLALDRNPITKMRLEKAGIKVLTYTGNELSLKTEGGPTCLTRPLKRI